MVEPDFKSMSYNELLEYALSHTESCGALEEYVKRQANDSNTITLDPKIDADWLNKLVSTLLQKSSNVNSQ